MKVSKSLICVLGGVCLAAGSAAQASHLSFLGTIDAIDTTFGAGGGAFSGSLSSTTDDAWLAFAANSGDNLSFTFQTIGANFMDGVVLFESSNGVVEVGDVANILNLNNDVSGQGTDLVAQHAPLGSGVCTGFYCIDTIGYTFGFTAAQTGQYVIALTSANESQATQFRVVMSGNTASIGAAVPEPASLALLGLALAGLGFRGRRG